MVIRLVALLTADFVAFFTAVDVAVFFLAAVDVFLVAEPVMDFAALVARLRAKEVAAAAIIVPNMVLLMPEDAFFPAFSRSFSFWARARAFSSSAAAFWAAFSASSYWAVRTS